MLQHTADLLDIDRQASKDNLTSLFHKIDELFRDEEDVDAIERNFASNEQKRFLHGFLENNHSSFVEYVNDVLSPDKNHFQKISFSEYLENYTSFHSNEIWFSGPSYFMRSARQPQDEYW